MTQRVRPGAARRPSAGGALAACVVSLALGCASPREVAVALIAPRDASGAIALPDDATRIELRLSRVSADDECPSVADAAAGRVRGELAHAQSFAIAEGMGRSIGELPDGQWTLTATGRTEACEVRLYGCVLFETARLGDEVEVPLVLADSAETCGCRACESGACSPEGRACP